MNDSIKRSYFLIFYGPLVAGLGLSRKLSGILIRIGDSSIRSYFLIFYGPLVANDTIMMKFYDTHSLCYGLRIL